MNPPRPPRQRPPAGVALVIVLSLVVLLTAIIVAFFSRAVLDRQTSSSTTAAARADVLARGALDEIVLDLKQEIAAGSVIDAPPANTPNAEKLTFYKVKPGSGTAVSTVMPALVQGPATGPISNPVNELKSSVFGKPFFAGANYDANFPASNLASKVNSAADPSLDGRFVSAARWNKPLLLDPAKLSGAAASASATVYNNYFAAPDWVLVTRGGPKAFDQWQGALKQDGDLTNMDYAVGRYAYMVYDEGGLLDINQAGFPNSLANDADFTARRGRLAQVDLGQIPGVTDPNALITGFRNPKTAASATSYKKYVVSQTPANPGARRVVPGDQTFVSRQDLLNYQSVNPSLLTVNSLQYLATFTREKNAPSFTPDPGRPKVKPGLAYPPEAGFEDPSRVISLDPGDPRTFGDDDKFNPSLLTTRNGNTQAGVLSRRFPLSRIALLGPSGPAAGASAADVKKYFGLVWDTAADAWVYVSPDGSGTMPASDIKYLKNIPSGRQPDFFETLQAAIHVGSLGRDSDGQQYYKPAYEPGTSSSARQEAQNVYNHVIQIGANIIDQADADSYPTVIKFGAEIVAGIENIPYASRVLDNVYRAPTDADTVFADYVFEMWNPHQDLPLSGPGPTDFRVVGVLGGGQIIVNGQYAAPVDITSLAPVGFSLTGVNYRSPVLLGAGFRVGEKTVKGNNVVLVYGAPFSTFALQYRGPAGKWREYQRVRRVAYQIKESFYLNPTDGYAKWFHQRVDPRTDRFGTSMNYLPGDGNTVPMDGKFGASAPLGSTIRPDALQGYFLGEDTLFNAGIFKFPGSGSVGASFGSNLGMLADNIQSTTAVYYFDPDGEVRPADGANRTGVTGQPLATNNFPSRPIILNRPFRSVGELGYVFRDVPFKSLDFINPKSGDLALLDAFCVDDADALAGRVNVNTRQPDVLTALLLGSARQEGTPTDAVNAAEARALAQALVTRTTDPAKGPLTDRTEIISKLAVESAALNPFNLPIKTQREAALRTLAETANFRTWNLLVDVIAQSGRYGSSATKLSAFNVTGERRYWLHVAIDRYTGEIVDQQLELVNE